MEQKKHYKQGRYHPRNISKYKGNVNNIFYRSSLELDFMKYLDCHPSILSWSSEELYVFYKHPFKNGMRKYYIDFVVEVMNKNKKRIIYAIEIKPKKQTIPPIITEKKNKRTILSEKALYRINMNKWKSAKEYCDKNGMIFKILTEDHIRRYNHGN
jgi:hypothetical protein